VAERTEAVLELLSGKATVDQLTRRFGWWDEGRWRLVLLAA
jgi:hypothetical protein